LADRYPEDLMPDVRARAALSAICLLAIAFAFTTVAAQTDLGSIDFPNSGSAEAQADFLRGVLLLHSFEYEDARNSFLRAQETDPDFALAYWGEAMTFNHPLWFQQDREGALEVLARFGATAAARAQRAPTERERLYLHALDVLYGEGDKAERDHAYLAAMRDLHTRFPDDQEAKAFYALSILGSVPARDFSTYMRAGAVAEEVYARNPRHPGAAHYMIHSYDDPIHAPLGVRAARSYAEIAPDASHAQHMISHIWTALGDWEQVVVANAAAVRVSEDRLERLGRSLAGRSKHALLWEEYGLLQQGRFDEAMNRLETARSDANEQPGRGNLWHFNAMRAAFIVAWPDHERVPESMTLTELGLGAQVTNDFANALRALALGDDAAAREAHGAIRGRIEAAGVTAAEEGRNAYDGATDPGDILVASIKAEQLEAMFEFRAGMTAAAIERLQRAAEEEAGRPLEYGPPSIEKPSHELLGEMLLADDRPEAAALAFEAALARAPRRSQSLRGLAAAAHASGSAITANAARQALEESWMGDPAWLGVSPAWLRRHQTTATESEH
jgi:tetratricopeptide (TPR) repeat protein